MNRLSFLVAVVSFLVYSTAIAQQKPGGTLGEPSNTFLNGNFISTQFENNGISDGYLDENFVSHSGLVYPKGSGKHSMHISGFLWGLKIPGDSQPRVGGSTYFPGLQPGKIISPGNPEDPNLPKNRIYRVRKDVYPGGPPADLSSEVADGEGTEAEIRTQYETDWNEWPWLDGAPFEDVNSNGTYEPGTDIPGYPGAFQTVWYVANDLNSELTGNLYGAPPVGMELQVTLWNYSQYGVLSHIYYRKYKMINKSDTEFQDVYVSMWSDVDVGQNDDNFVGSDSVLNLLYSYNGDDKDDVYGSAPSAIGFDLLKGPDNLPMTAAYYFTNGDPNIGDPPQGNIEGSSQFYNFFQGKFGISGQPFIDIVTGQITTYALNGDPITQQGWLDGIQLPEGKRRMGMASGPFQMAVGDTQEVVFEEVVAAGIDYINAIKLLRFYSILGNDIFDNNFNFTPAPKIPQPVVTVTEFESSIELSWDSDTSSVNAIENFEQDGFTFQGYNVYQLYSTLPFKGNAKRLATYDVVDGVTQIEGDVMNPETGYPETGVQQYGSDSGILRDIVLNGDSIENTYFIPGKKYYFAVTAYAYNSDQNADPNNTESLIQLIEVTFHDTVPCPHYGDEMVVHHTQGESDAEVHAVVVDPFQLTNHQYKVDFDTTLLGTLVWNLTDLNTNTVILEFQGNISGDDESPIADGLQFRVKADLKDVKRFSMTSNGNGPITSTVGYDVTETPPFNAYSADWYRDVMLGENGGSTVLPNGMQVLGGYFFCVAGGPTIIDYESALNRWTRNGARWTRILGNNYEMRFTSDGGYAWMAFSTGSLVTVPFELWYLGDNLDDPSDDVRYFPWIFDENDNDIFDFLLDHQASDGNDDPYSDWIYFEQPEDNPPPGEQAYNDLVALISQDPPGWDGHIEIEHIARFVLMNYDMHQAPGTEDALPETGTTFLIEFPKPVVPGEDEYTVTNVILSSVEPDIVADNYVLNQNYPNPFNPSTIISFKLPQQGHVNLTVFNILGQQVAKLIDKEMLAGEHSVTFNAKGLASGVYIYLLNVEGKFFRAKKMMLLK